MSNITNIQIIIWNMMWGMSLLLAIPREDKQGLKIFSILLSLSIAWMFFWIYLIYDVEEIGYQFSSTISILPNYGIDLSFGVDGSNILFLLLTACIIPVCIYATESVTKNLKQFLFYIFLIEFFLILAFLSTNAFFFYVFFESVLIPMYFLIGEWGSRERKTNAALYIFLYTLFGSFFFLYGLLYIYKQLHSFDMEVISEHVFKKDEQIFLFLFLFVPFAVKIPMLPFHLWLLEAHVEAPTIGSVILASLLLKLGGYGFLRYTIIIAPLGCEYFYWLITSLGVLSVIYASFSAIRQNDFKRIIAYSSVAHMNIVVLGIFSFSVTGISGAIYLMLSHGIVSSALFLCVGVLYDRFHSRSLRNFSGLAIAMPLFGAFFFLFTCANMSFPLTANFVGEFLVLIGVFQWNPFLMIACSCSVFLSAIYAIWCFNRAFFGTLKTEKENISGYADLNRREVIIFSIFLIATIILGIYAQGVTDVVDPAVQEILISIASKK